MSLLSCSVKGLKLSYKNKRTPIIYDVRISRQFHLSSVTASQFRGDHSPSVFSFLSFWTLQLQACVDPKFLNSQRGDQTRPTATGGGAG